MLNGINIKDMAGDRWDKKVPRYMGKPSISNTHEQETIKKRESCFGIETDDKWTPIEHMTSK